MARKATDRQTETPPDKLWAADSVYFTNEILANSFMGLDPISSVSLSLVICLTTSLGMVSTLSAANVVPLSVPASHAGNGLAGTLSFHSPSSPQSSTLSTPTNQSGEGAIIAMTETLEYMPLAVMIMVLVAVGSVLSSALNTLYTYPPLSFTVVRSLYSVASVPD